MNNAQKAQLKYILVEHGLWRPYHRIRDHYKKQLNYSPKEAQDRAISEFFPNGGIGTTPSLPEGCTEDATDPGIPLPSRGDPKPVADRSAKGKAIKASSRLSVPYQDRDLGLIDATHFKGSKANRVQVIDWVASQIATKRVDIAGCPSTEAWGLLRWARRTQANECDFWKTIYRPPTQTKSELEAMARFQDNGQSVFSVIDKLQHAIRKEKDATPATNGATTFDAATFDGA